MYKRYIHRICCVFIAVLIIFTCASCDFVTELEPFDAQYPDYINYNNYNQTNNLYGGSMDYRNGTLAYSLNTFLSTHSLVVTVDENAEKQIITDISVPFRLTDKGIVYAKGLVLKYRDQDNNTHKITDHVSRFIVWQQYVLYTEMKNVNFDDPSIYEDYNPTISLYIYNLETHQTELLKDDVYEFAIYEDYVYTIGFDDEILNRIHLETRKLETLMRMSIDLYPYSMQFCDGYMVSLGYDKNYNEEFVFMNLNDLTSNSIPIYEEGGGSPNIAYICEGDTIYYSYCALNYDGSFSFTDDDHPYNGTYKLNIHTKETIRLSEYIYYELYCFDKTHLYGINDKGAVCEIETNV